MTKSFEDSALMEWIVKANEKNYLIFFCITSQAQGKIPIEGISFGMGKSTLSLWISYLVYKYHLKKKGVNVTSIDGINQVWDIVFQNLFMRPRVYDQYIFRGPDAPHPPTILTKHGAIPVIVADDMQETVGKNNRFDPYLQALAMRLTKARDWVSVVVGTMPKKADLFKWYRDLFTMELIIPTRGTFEFQRTIYKKSFRDWDTVIAKGWYESEGKKFGFPPLPTVIERRYKKWVRAEQHIIDIARWSQDKQKPIDEPPVPDSEATIAARALVNRRWRKDT